jgi:hypothetical protein
VQQEDVDSEVNHPRKNYIWYYKIEAFINHVREINSDLIHVLGTCISLDEMMIRFLGQSLESHRMKNKPISEGFKFFVLTNTLGYVVNFTPDGRTAAKTGRQEYAASSTERKIKSMVKFITSTVDEFCALQKERFSKKTRASHAETEDDIEMEIFCLGMDNYFTLPKVIQGLRDNGIGVVGTARFRKGWPPCALQQIQQKDCDFNEFRYLVDENGTLLARWMDNGLVFCVSTLHHVGTTIKIARKRP